MGTLLYDGECGFCTSSALWLQDHVISSARVVPWQRAELDALGVSAQAASESVHWVDGNVKAAGPEAIAAYLRSSTTGWRAAGRVLGVPPFRTMAWPVYHWVSRHRGNFPGGPPALEAGPSADAPARKVAVIRAKVRRRKDSDIVGCSRLLYAVLADGRVPTSTPKPPDGWLGNGVLAAWIIKPDWRIVGHVAIVDATYDPIEALRWRELTGHEPATLAAVSRLLVRPEARGQGLGTALLEVAVKEIRRRGRTPVLSAVHVSTDDTRLYERLGWRLLAIFPWGAPGDGLQIRYYAAGTEV